MMARSVPEQTPANSAEIRGVSLLGKTAGSLKWIGGAAAVLALLLFQTGCLFGGKKKAAVSQVVPAGPTRVVALPLNIPADNQDLRWMALAAPIVSAKTMENSPDLETAPFWEGLPAAVEALGQSREITPEIAAYITTRVGAKWSSVGEMNPGKNGVALLLDFIPGKSSLVGYRYQKEAKPEDLAPHYYEAVSQFLRYLVARPLPKQAGGIPDQAMLKQLAEALDREYGWFVAADPGKSDALVAQLVKTDAKLARLLFNPVIYPVLGAPTPKPKAPDVKPMIAPPPAASPRPPQLPAPAEPVPQPAPEPAEKVPEAPAPTPSPPKEPAVDGSRPLKVDETANAVPFVPIPRPRSTNRPAEITSFQAILSKSPVREVPIREEQQSAGAAATHPVSAQPATVLPSVAPAPAVQPPSAPTTAAQPNASPPSSIQPRSAAAATTAPKPAGKPPVAEEKGYKVQVFASPNFEESNTRAKALQKLGYKAVIEEVDLNEKGIWYRLRLVGFPSRLEARKAGEKLKAARTISQFWIVP